MKYTIIIAATLCASLTSAWANENDAGSDSAYIQNEIDTAQKSRDDAETEIKSLKVKLEKVQNEINSSETKIEEIQAKIDAKQ